MKERKNEGGRMQEQLLKGLRKGKGRKEKDRVRKERKKKNEEARV